MLRGEFYGDVWGEDFCFKDTATGITLKTPSFIPEGGADHRLAHPPGAQACAAPDREGIEDDVGQGEDTHENERTLKGIRKGTEDDGENRQRKYAEPLHQGCF